MKKGLVVLLILAMVAGAAFAQEVKFSGTVEAGIEFEQAGDSDVKVTPYNTDSEKGLRAQLDAAVDFDNYGLKIRFRADDTGDFSSGSQAFLWGEFLNDIIKVSGGKLGGVWSTDGDEGFSLDGINGVRFEFKPLPGLDFGVALDATPYAARAAAKKSYVIGEFFQETVLGVKYTSDLFSATLAYKLDSDADGLDNKEGELVFGLKISAIPALTAIIEGDLKDLGADDNAVGFEIHEYFGFQISDPFEAHLNFDEVGNFDELKNSNIFIKPGLSFGISDSVTLKGDLGFGIFTAKDSAIEIDIQPGVEYKFSDKTSINGWYKGIINAAGNKDADFVNQVQVDFIWAF
jgi:hypothetical protein